MVTLQYYIDGGDFDMTMPEEERSNNNSSRNRPRFASGVSVSRLSTNFGKSSPTAASGADKNGGSVPTPQAIKSPTGNPLKYDSELISLLDKLDTIQSYRQFRKWKASFLRRFQSFLQQDGARPAQKTYATYSENVERLEKKIDQVRKIMDEGNLTVEKTTVKGRNALNEMIKTMNSVIEETDSLIPATKAEEKRKQYTKYHLGAVLVEDGFLEYDQMVRCNEKKKELLSLGLSQIADRQQLDAIERYDRQIQQFVHVMQDLGLHEVMRKCRQFLHGDLEEVILLDPKSGDVIEIPRDVLIEKGILTLYQDDQGAEKIREEEVSRAERFELATTARSKFGIL